MISLRIRALWRRVIDSLVCEDLWHEGYSGLDRRGVAAVVGAEGQR